MAAIHQIIPNAEDLLKLEPEELAPILLKYLCSEVEQTWKPSFKRGNVFSGSASPGKGYGDQFADRVDQVLTAAWVWLEREGILLPAPGNQDRDWVVVSSRGRALLIKENMDAYKLGLLFPRKTLHPAISSSTFALFLRGHYDTVVFEAFRAVEVAVREAGKLPLTLIGTGLMRKAFAPVSGELSDVSLLPAEQEATSNLFAGAIGLFKNPTSHRADAINKPEDAVALVMLADYLLRMVEERATATRRESE